MIFSQDKQEADAKNRTSTNSASKLTIPLEMVRKHFMLLNRSILRSELVVSPKLQFLCQDEKNTDTKTCDARNSASELTSPLEIVKKTCQALESLNSDV